MELVRCGIAGAAPRQGLFRGLSGADWETIYTLARRQTVCGICYDAYCKLPDSLLPGGTLLPRWVARVNAIETSNRAMGIAVAQLVESLGAMGLHPLLQKGLSVARFYSNPELRECGDIDLWLPADEMDRAIDFARQHDSRLKSHPDASISFIFRMNRHGRIAEHCLRPRRRKFQKFRLARLSVLIHKRVFDMPEMTCLLLIFHFRVRN